MLPSYGFSTDQDSTPWYKQPLPKDSVGNERDQILWDIPIHLGIAPRDGANKPDIMVMDKKKGQWILIEGTVCNVGCIDEQSLYKQHKYTDLRAGLKRLYLSFSVTQVNIAFDFLAGYNEQLVIDLDKIGIKDKNNLIRQCQKWVISQKCEIVKAVY